MAFSCVGITAFHQTFLLRKLDMQLARTCFKLNELPRNVCQGNNIVHMECTAATSRYNDGKRDIFQPRQPLVAFML